MLSNLNRLRSVFTGDSLVNLQLNGYKKSHRTLHMLLHPLMTNYRVRCGGIVNNQIKKGLLLSLSEKKLKSVNLWQSYKQERGCLMHFARLANTLLTDEETARDNHVLAGNFAKYSLRFILLHVTC